LFGEQFRSNVHSSELALVSPKKIRDFDLSAPSPVYPIRTAAASDAKAACCEGAIYEGDWTSHYEWRISLLATGTDWPPW